MESKEVRTIEQMEEYFNQYWLNTMPSGGNQMFQDGMDQIIRFVKNMIPNLKETYCSRKTEAKPVIPSQPKVVPFKVGQVLRRTSDGLKCMIVQNQHGYVYLVQQNNGRQFANGVMLSGTDVFPETLAQISGGYSFVTEKQGKEQGLFWAKEQVTRDQRGVETPRTAQQESMTSIFGNTYPRH